MFAFLEKPASQGLIAAASSLVCVCFEQLANQNDATAMSGLATGQIHRHARFSASPPKPQETLQLVLGRAAR